MQPTATTVKTQPAPVRLVDYRPPPYLVSTVELLFDLHETHADVTSTVAYRKNPAAGGSDDLVLAAVDLELRSLRLDGEELGPDEWTREGDRLRLRPPRPEFVLTAVTRIHPESNTKLEGLYRSQRMFCTQMEAQGFRRVTPFQDRPDVLGVWRTTIEADRTRYPVLLSNGNLVETGEVGGGRHRATWADPHPKPCYLFALVAGDLGLVEDRFRTRSGRQVALRVYVDRGNEDRAAHALDSLKKAMRWDEERFGREVDLDAFMIVAVADFNLGAMENKGLNLFNAQAVLANPATATDEDFARIQGVVGHEYFHNWSGNRVTCRDWFQLSLKEGFTVYRDQEFRADCGDRAVQRIDDVQRLRELQFPEDEGPLAHPVRPTSYIAIENFYTPTIYEKGAEVIRMLATTLGREGFRRGTDLYFSRHDGQAVTVEDFRAALSDATGVDLAAFARWYDQAGTPRLHVRGRHDAGLQQYELVVEQSCPPSPGQREKQPFPIPLRLALLAPDGRQIPLRLLGEPLSAATSSRVLLLTEARKTFRFADVSVAPVPSLLRGCSAPVRLDDGLGEEELSFLAVADEDLFQRWEALQRLLAAALLRLAADAAGGARLALPERLRETFGRLLADESPAAAFRARLLQLPEPSVVAALQEIPDPDALGASYRFLRSALARAHADALAALYERQDARPPAPAARAWDAAAAGHAALKNACLRLLAALPGGRFLARAERQLREARNMTDEQAALAVLADHDGPLRTGALQHFRERWASDALVLNEWFEVQAAATRPGTADEVVRLAQDPAFSLSNPNKVRALYRTFARNYLAFHEGGGKGYRVLADVVAALDGKNPILAARLATQLDGWRRLDPVRGQALRSQLERLLASSGLSENVYEVASKALE